MQNLTFNRNPSPLAKSSLVTGAYYVGVCRNASIARWDGEQFWHWRVKFAQRFLESIKHRDDDDVYDVFDAWMRCRIDEVAEIPCTLVGPNWNETHRILDQDPCKVIEPEVERTAQDSGLCCIAAHAQAIPPWTCSCACHVNTEQSEETNATSI